VGVTATASGESPAVTHLRGPVMVYSILGSSTYEEPKVSHLALTSAPAPFPVSRMFPGLMSAVDEPPCGAGTPRHGQCFRAMLDRAGAGTAGTPGPAGAWCGRGGEGGRRRKRGKEQKDREERRGHEGEERRWEEERGGGEERRRRGEEGGACTRSEGAVEGACGGWRCAAHLERAVPACPLPASSRRASCSSA